MKVTRNEKAKFLTKEEELHLGGIIQEYLAAEEVLNSSEFLKDLDKKALNNKVNLGKQAAEKLVLANVGLVHDRARSFKSRYPGAPDLEDLVSEGMIGMMTAIKKYDPARGNKFSTVAYYWIAQSIARGTNKTGRLVRLPENRINDLGNISKIANSAQCKNLSPSEVDEIIIEKLNISKSDLYNIRSAAGTPAALNKVVSSDSGAQKELLEFVAVDKVGLSSESEAIRVEMRTLLQESVKELGEMKQDIILSLFDISDSEVMSPEQVRSKYNIQQFKFKKFQTEAVRELKEILEDKDLTFSDFVSL